MTRAAFRVRGSAPPGSQSACKVTANSKSPQCPPIKRRIDSEDEMRKAKPDYLLVLPWHFINEFVERESEFLRGGGKFIVPCPTFEIIGM